MDSVALSLCVKDVVSLSIEELFPRSQLPFRAIMPFGPPQDRTLDSFHALRTSQPALNARVLHNLLSRAL